MHTMLEQTLVPCTKINTILKTRYSTFYTQFIFKKVPETAKTFLPSSLNQNIINEVHKMSTAFEVATKLLFGFFTKFVDRSPKNTRGKINIITIALCCLSMRSLFFGREIGEQSVALSFHKFIKMSKYCHLQVLFCFSILLFTQFHLWANIFFREATRRAFFHTKIFCHFLRTALLQCILVCF